MHECVRRLYLNYKFVTLIVLHAAFFMITVEHDGLAGLVGQRAISKTCNQACGCIVCVNSNGCNGCISVSTVGIWKEELLLNTTNTASYRSFPFRRSTPPTPLHRVNHNCRLPDRCVHIAQERLHFRHIWCRPTRLDHCRDQTRDMPGVRRFSSQRNHNRLITIKLWISGASKLGIRKQASFYLPRRAVKQFISIHDPRFRPLTWMRVLRVDQSKIWRLKHANVERTLIYSGWWYKLECAMPSPPLFIGQLNVRMS